MNHNRKGYALARAATREVRTFWRYVLFGTTGRDAFGRWSWAEAKSVNGIGGVAAYNTGDLAATVLRQGTSTNRPMILPLFPFTVGDNFHPVFITAFSDTGKPCWIDSDWYGWSINAVTYGIGTPA